MRSDWIRQSWHGGCQGRCFQPLGHVGLVPVTVRCCLPLVQTMDFGLADDDGFFATLEDLLCENFTLTVGAENPKP